MSHRKIKEKDKPEIIEKYKTGKYNCVSLAEEYGYKSTSVRYLLKSLNIPIISNQSIIKRKYKINENYFDVVDTEEKAYFLGFLYADGNISKRDNAISLALEYGDKEILEKFNVSIESDKPIYFCKRGKPHHKDLCKLSIVSKNIKQSLINLGCHPNKTFTLEFPTEKQVPKELLRHFLRGIWDGDGCFSIGLYKNKYRRLIATIISTENMCNGIKEYLYNEILINSTVSFPKALSKTTRRLSFCGILQVFTFLNWIYCDSNIFLSRKYKKYMNIQETLLIEGKFGKFDLFESVDSKLRDGLYDLISIFSKKTLNLVDEV